MLKSATLRFARVLEWLLLLVDLAEILLIVLGHGHLLCAGPVRLALCALRIAVAVLSSALSPHE